MADPRGRPRHEVEPVRFPTAPSTAPPWRHRGWHRPRQGHRVGVRPARRHDRDPQPQGGAPGRGREAIGALGATVHTETCDIREPDQIAAAFDGIEAVGRPSVLINNAAANFPVPAEDMSPNAWRTVVDITLNGTFFAHESSRAGTCRRHARLDRERRRVPAWTGGPGFAHSAAAKAGVKNMVETLAVEWGPYGIQVNGLVPGLFPHEDMTADIQANLARTGDKDRTQPAWPATRARLAATFLRRRTAGSSAATRSGRRRHWQRRSLTTRWSPPRPDGQGPPSRCSPALRGRCGNTFSGRDEGRGRAQQAWARSASASTATSSRVFSAARARTRRRRSPLAP